MLAFEVVSRPTMLSAILRKSARFRAAVRSRMAFAELWPVLDGISAAAQARLTTMPTGEWANTRH